MRNILLLLGLVLGLPSLPAGTVVDPAVVSPEDVFTGKGPLTCEVLRRKDGSVSLKLSVVAQSSAKGHFEGFDLRVLRKPLAASEIKAQVLREELLAWHRPSSDRVALFVLTEEEIPKSYIVGRWSLGPDPVGRLQVKEVCLAVEALVDAAIKKPRQTPEPTPATVPPPAAREPRQP